MPLPEQNPGTEREEDNAEDDYAEQAYWLSRLMFGWIADAHLGTRRYAISGEEYVRRATEAIR